jgi:hypothetical protein
MALKLPTSELVAVAYAKRVLALAGVTAPVVTTLPDVAGWATTGALQVESIVGTTVRENGLRDVVISYGGWGARPGSDKPPWGQANGLLEYLVESETWDWENALRLELEPANTYEAVRVQGGQKQTEPRRVPDPDTSRAHFTMDFRLIWGRV